MPVGIVARELSVIYPEDALGTEVLLQTLFNLVLAEGLVAMRSEQAARGGEDGALSVAFDRAPFEHEVEMVDILSPDRTVVIEASVDGIVELGREFLAPAVEAKI